MRPLLALRDYLVVECTRCGLGTLRSRSGADVPTSPTYYEERIAFATDWRQWDEGSRPQFGAILRGIKRWRPSGRLLDVGCGGGFFLRLAAEAGYTPAGIETSEVGAAHAEALLGIEIWRKPLEQLGLPEGAFDAVTLNNVLEHLEHPRESLREVFHVLRPGGVLAVSVPNLLFGKIALAVTRGAPLLGRPNPAATIGVFHAPVHRYHFNHTTLRALCQHVGLRVIAVHSEVPVRNPGSAARNAVKLGQYSLSEMLRTVTRDRWIVGHGITLYALKPAS